MVIWTDHAKLRLRQRFAMAVEDMARHERAIIDGAKFFGGREANIRVGIVRVKCVWSERQGSAIVITVHDWDSLNVGRNRSRRSRSLDRGRLAASRGKWREGNEKADWKGGET